MITDEDRISRVGRITGSRMKDVLAKSKRDGKSLQAREDYMAQLVLERLTGQAHGIPMTVAMQWGVDTEAYALAAYEAHTGELLDTCPFTLVDGCGFVGASPDALVGSDGLLEAKCPYQPIVHMRTWLDGMPADHMPQLQSELWCTGRQWVDYVSFDPRMPPHLRLYIQRIPRDDDYIKMLHEECSAFNREIDAMVEKLKCL